MTGNPYSHGMWIAALVAAFGLVDSMYVLLAQLLILAAWGDAEAWFSR